MSLNHYTNSVAAISILESGVFWMGRTGEAKRDQKEINHFFQTFIYDHTYTEIQNLLHTEKLGPSGEPALIGVLQTIAQSFRYFKDRLSIGEFVASILRNESYMVCFTETEFNSVTFHGSEYGEVCFSFSKNPFVNKFTEYFNMIEEKVTYLDTSKTEVISEGILKMYKVILKDLKEIVNKDNSLDGMLLELYDFNMKKYEKLDTQKILKQMIKDVDKLHQEYKYIYDDFINTIRQLLQSKGKQKMEVAEYIDKKVIELREPKLLSLFSENFANIFKATGQFRKSNIVGHVNNLISCFIKDVEFVKDNETRIIALPKKEFKHPENGILQMPYDLGLLRSITVSPNCKNRESVINKLQNLLDSKQANHVIVR